MSFFSQLRTALDTAFLGWRRPRPPLLPAPAAIVAQPPGSKDCAPALVCTLAPLLGARAVQMPEARAALLRGDPRGTRVEDLPPYLESLGLRAALLFAPAGGMFEAVRTALHGGAYAIPLIVKGGNGHFVLAYAVDGEALCTVDPEPPNHWWVQEHKAFEAHVARLSRYTSHGAVVIVRRK